MKTNTKKIDILIDNSNREKEKKRKKKRCKFSVSFFAFPCKNAPSKCHTFKIIEIIIGKARASRFL
jgi:hypothetical protein